MEVLRIPALISKMGDWRYYISSMTFDQISSCVSKVDKELHKSEKLSELIQRSITSNYKNIKDYIVDHEDRFFNSIVLAVYEGDPQFREIDFEFENKRYGTLGLLEFTGQEVIFPVDGQHRVEGIKAALEEDPSLGEDKISVIFIGHRNDQDGLERTRRLFSTLNRYAKPVKKSDIIALDEDDLVAITTRYLVDNNELFTGNGISLERTLQENDTTSFTTIETLYDCNGLLLSNFLKENEISGPLDKYKTKRPPETTINMFQEVCMEFWNDFRQAFDSVQSYVDSNKSSVSDYRNRQGGNVLFRPAGLSPFIKAISSIKSSQQIEYREILRTFGNIDMSLNAAPWKHVLWNVQEDKVILNTKTLVELLNIFLYEKRNQISILTAAEKIKLKQQYSSKLMMDVSDVEEILDEL
ncbi:DNA sulfur modification protein DndB [Bacillus toyonensis]|uniref:DNA sulfur modification protein DndB n=1 Tax=Bacillus toyonensis TaxID=155322 RepID=UPI000BFC2905|nr:DNA sulfur modification protein DndB [Bacillus toyonensis]PHG70098.1 DndB [Bacillus toyonensis]